jgi:hypothetical protein
VAGASSRTVVMVVVAEVVSSAITKFRVQAVVRCAIFDGNLHSGMPLDRTLARFNCSLEASRCAIDGIHVVCSLPLPVDTVNSVQTRKVLEATVVPVAPL